MKKFRLLVVGLATFALLPLAAAEPVFRPNRAGRGHVPSSDHCLVSGGNVITRSLFAAALLAVGLGLVSCGGGPAAPSVGSNPGDSPLAAATAATKGSAAVIHLVLTGGPAAGTFDLNSSEKCQFLTQPTFKAWQANFSDNSPTAKVTYFIISVDVKQSPAKFSVAGTVAGAPMYQASTIAGSDTGSADVQDAGTTAKISAAAKTKEGYGITATVQCNQVQRLP